MSGTATARALVLGLLAPAGCFYTTTINDRPRAEITILSPGPHYPTVPIVLSGMRSSDEQDGSAVKCSWTALQCIDALCAATETAALQRSGEVNCSDEFIVVPPPREHLPIAVELEVTDNEGGELRTRQIFEVGNREPDVQVQIRPSGTADHAVIGVPVEAYAMATDPDDDPVSLEWRLDKARGAGAEVALAPIGDDGLAQTFTPDVAGLWSVEVSAGDGVEQGSGTASISVDEDGPPCLALTSPAAGLEPRLVLRREDAPRAFSVLRVSDDLDPYPLPPDPAPYLGEPGFAWQIASPDTGGELVPVAGATGAELTVDPSLYEPGDVIDLRVEVADRVARSLPCDPAAPTCALSGDACQQRLSWGVEIR